MEISRDMTEKAERKENLVHIKLLEKKVKFTEKKLLHS